MHFESFSNEIFLCIFEFLSTGHLINAFHGLNHRFNSILCTHLSLYGIDCRSMFDKDFNTICVEYLPTLCLTRKFHDPGLLDRLAAHNFTFDKFVQLKSLSLSHFYIEDFMESLNLTLAHLINLTHIRSDDCDMTEDDNEGHPITVWIKYVKIRQIYNIFHCPLGSFFLLTSAISCSINNFFRIVANYGCL